MIDVKRKSVMILLGGQELEANMLTMGDISAIEQYSVDQKVNSFLRSALALNFDAKKIADVVKELSTNKVSIEEVEAARQAIKDGKRPDIEVNTGELVFTLYLGLKDTQGMTLEDVGHYVYPENTIEVMTAIGRLQPDPTKAKKVVENMENLKDKTEEETPPQDISPST